MKTLVVYFSKTGNTKKVAEAIISNKGYDFDEIIFDENAKSISKNRNPADYERVIIMSPVWAFNLAEPVQIYLSEHGADIKQYDLIVTYSLFGMGVCVKNCVSAIGKPPENKAKFKASRVKQGNFDISKF